MPNDPTPKVSQEAVEELRRKVSAALKGGGYVDAAETEDVARETLALLDALPAIRSSVLEELREELLSEPAVEAAKAKLRPAPGDYLRNHHVRRGFKAALDSLASEGGER